LLTLVRTSKDGHYSTEDEVVADAHRLMQARDEVAEIKRARLKDAIDRGYEDAATRNVPTQTRRAEHGVPLTSMRTPSTGPSSERLLLEEWMSPTPSTPGTQVHLTERR
jgi:hypothetical protein